MIIAISQVKVTTGFTKSQTGSTEYFCDDFYKVTTGSTEYFCDGFVDSCP